jgi:hypothetical protein
MYYVEASFDELLFPIWRNFSRHIKQNSIVPATMLDFKAQDSLYTRTLLLTRLSSLHLSLVTAENPDGLYKDAFGNYPGTDMISFPKLLKLNFTGNHEIIRLHELLFGLFNETRLIAPFVPR